MSWGSICVGSDEGVDLLLNGLGCRSQEPPTDIELRFIKKQNDLKWTPSACADALLCRMFKKLRCGNAGVCKAPAVIQACYRVWKTVVHRFGHAVECYETLLLKIDLRLGLVDEATLKKRALNFSEKVWLRYGRLEEKRGKP